MLFYDFLILYIYIYKIKHKKRYINFSIFKNILSAYSEYFQ